MFKLCTFVILNDTEMNTQNTRDKSRVGEIDFLKCVMILLMIVFHLVFVGDTYPFAKRLVYTFHMPAFLIISGYVLNCRKDSIGFVRSMLWIFIPYMFMESAYTIMASLLPIREHVDNLSMSLLIGNVFVHPLGPYWYLHTLILCSIVSYAVFRIPFPDTLSKTILLVMALFFCSEYLHIVSLTNALYFAAGVVIRQSGVAFVSFFRANAFSIVPIVLLAIDASNLDKSAFGGIAIVYLSVSFFLFIYRFLPDIIRLPSLFIGRNTLLLLLFSPIFTFIAKYYQPYILGIEPYGILFILLSVLFVLAGCFSIGLLSDVSGISRFAFGKRKIIC